MPASSRDDAPARRERQRLLSDAGEGRLHGSEDHDIPTERARDQFRRRGRKIPLPNETGAREDRFAGLGDPRSEERRGGEEWVSTCRSRRSPDHSTKNNKRNKPN